MPRPLSRMYASATGQRLVVVAVISVVVVVVVVLVVVVVVLVVVVVDTVVVVVVVSVAVVPVLKFGSELSIAFGPVSRPIVTADLVSIAEVVRAELIECWPSALDDGIVIASMVVD